MFREVKKNFRQLSLLLLIVAAAFLLWGCGGGGSDSYTDLDAEYMSNDATAMATVEPATVKTWVDNNLIIPETGQRVIILDCVPNPAGIFSYSDTESWFAGDATKIKANMKDQYGSTDAPQYLMIDTLAAGNLLGHIPGAIPNVSHEGYEVTARNDGPIKADHEVGTGDLIDQLLQKYGVTKDDVIVLTTSRYDYPGFCPARMWWTLRYWGFARDHIQVLNGGNKAYAMYMKANFPAEAPLETGVTTTINVTPSTFSVTELPDRNLEERISLGELIDDIDSGRTTLPDNDPDKVIIIDTRQPPVAYYFKDVDTNGVPDIFEATINGYSWDATHKVFSNGTDTLNLSQILFTDANGLQIPFDPTSNPPINVTAAPGSTWLAINMKPGVGPLAIPLGAKPAAFEGTMRGAKLTKTSAYNITIPALSNADGSYKTPEEMRAVFAAAGIDGTKPIITYCNSGALAAIYYYALKEIAGFEDVKLYDGSWGEWANLTAFEPETTDYVIHDNYAVYPHYPAGSPKLQIFAGANNYFTYDPASGTFVDAATGAEVAADAIMPGGQLAGSPLWDAITRSQNVAFRATATVKDDYRTYKPGVNWPTVTTYPDYDGPANKIFEEDQAYEGSIPSSGSSAPTAFVPTGGGC